MKTQIQYKSIIINHSNFVGERFPYESILSTINNIIDIGRIQPFKTTDDFLMRVWKDLDDNYSDLLFRISIDTDVLSVDENGNMNRFKTITIDVYDDSTIENINKSQ